MLKSWFVRASFLGSVLLSSLSFSSCATVDTRYEGQKLPKAQSPEEETKTVVEAVQGSGDAAADVKDLLSRAADAVFDQTFGSSTPDAERSGKASCYRGGCLHHVIYRDQCAALDAKRAAIEIPNARLLDWPGAIYKTPAVRLADGRLDVTWALLVADPQSDRARLEALLKPAVPEKPIFRPEVCRRAGSADIGIKPNAPVSVGGAAPAAPQVNPNAPRSTK
jgi:hypothetical protein